MRVFCVDCGQEFQVVGEIKETTDCPVCNSKRILEIKEVKKNG